MPKYPVTISNPSFQLAYGPVWRTCARRRTTRLRTRASLRDTVRTLVLNCPTLRVNTWAREVHTFKSAFLERYTLNLLTRNISMSLRFYRLPRMVVLKPEDPVLEAARAIENNRIGAVVVQDQRRVVGLLTDRDLAVRVVGRGLDPKLTTLDQVMSTPVATLSPADSHDDAIRLMQQRNIRRVPLVEDGRIVGIVTLDDLLKAILTSLREMRGQNKCCKCDGDKLHLNYLSHQ